MCTTVESPSGGGEPDTQPKAWHAAGLKPRPAPATVREGMASREGPFANKLNNDRKYVVSTTLQDPAWQNTTVISGNVVDRIATLKDEVEGVVLVAGSGTLVRTLLAVDLVDELRRWSSRRSWAEASGCSRTASTGSS